MGNIDMTQEYEEIISEITSGLTGESEVDIKYLLEKTEEFKEHELSIEIIRAIGRMVAKIAPEELLGMVEKESQKAFMSIDAIVEEAHFNYYKKDYKKALELIEKAVNTLENDMLQYKDDQISEYHFFRNFLEEVLYEEFYAPTKEIRRIPEDYSEVYYMYGVILFEMNRLDESEIALKKAMKINPIRLDVLSELSEIYKQRKDWTKYLDLSKRCLECAYSSEGIAKAYRNLGFYYTEIEDYNTSVALYIISMQFDKSPMANNELMYIQQVTGKPIEPPSADEVKAILTKHDISIGVNKTVLDIAYAIAVTAEEENFVEQAVLFYNIVFDLTDDEEIKNKIEQLSN